MRAAVGTSSRSSSTRFTSKSLVRLLSPVTFPPGCERLVTTVSGSPIDAMTTGILRVAFLAATAAGVPRVTIRSTFRRTSSVAKSAKRSPRPSAERYSIMRFRPSTYPRSRIPCRKASRLAAFSALDIVSNIPTRQTLPCRCAKAPSGTARTPLATLPTNARRSITQSVHRQMEVLPYYADSVSPSRRSSLLADSDIGE